MLQQHYNNTTKMLQQSYSEFPLENQQQKKEEHIPECFYQKFCHIKQICRVKEYNNKTSMLCPGCVWFKSTAWTGTHNSIRNVG